MNPSIQTWLKAREATKAAQEHEDHMLEKANNAPLPTSLRHANARDCATIGQILWYPRFEDDRKWVMVEEVEHYGDHFKAYTAHDGCRYGLDGAFVEV